MILLSHELKSAKGKCRPHRNSVPRRFGCSPATPAKRQRADSTGRRLPVPPGFQTLQTTALAGLAARQSYQELPGKQINFLLKTLVLPTSMDKLERKALLKAFLTCPDSDYVLS